MTAAPAEILATSLFALAVLHTFSVKKFAHWAHQHPKGSVQENLLHFMAETAAILSPSKTVLLPDLAQAIVQVGPHDARGLLLVLVQQAHRLLGQRVLVAQRPAATADAPGGVRALTEATDAAIDELAQWLTQLR